MPKEGPLSSGKEFNIFVNICFALRVSVASLEIDQRMPDVLEDVKHTQMKPVGMISKAVWSCLTYHPPFFTNSIKSAPVAL